MVCQHTSNVHWNVMENIEITTNTEDKKIIIVDMDTGETCYWPQEKEAQLKEFMTLYPNIRVINI